MANVKVVKGISDTTEFCKKWLELATGREFTKVQDNASKYERDGKGYSYLLQLGDGNASTRFQVWVTARKTARIDMYIGNAYIQTETVDVSTLIDYRKGNDNGKGNTYRNVPMHVVKSFFDSNALTVKKSDTVKKSESVTA